jgi:hypothetical protein
MVAQMPTLAAFAFRHRLSMPHPYPDTEFALVGPSPVLDRQDRAWRQAHHFLGDTAQEHVLEAGAAMGAHDDEIRTPLLSDADNGVRRVSHGDGDFR